MAGSNRLDPRYMPLRYMLKPHCVVEVNQEYRGRMFPLTVSYQGRPRKVFIRGLLNPDVELSVFHLADGNVAIQASFSFLISESAFIRVLSCLEEPFKAIDILPDRMAAKVLRLSTSMIKRLKSSRRTNGGF